MDRSVGSKHACQLEQEGNEEHYGRMGDQNVFGDRRLQENWQYGDREKGMNVSADMPPGDFQVNQLHKLQPDFDVSQNQERGDRQLQQGDWQTKGMVMMQKEEGMALDKRVSFI
jgi:hypothetical protein